MSNESDKRFVGKTALISGGASGIGLATAKRMIADGATVWIADIQDELGESVAEEISATMSISTWSMKVNGSRWLSSLQAKAKGFTL